MQQITDYQSVYSHYFLSFGTNDVTDFLKVTRIISPPNHHLRFSIVVPETFKFRKKGLACAQYLELNHACDKVRLSIRTHGCNISVLKF